MCKYSCRFALLLFWFRNRIFSTIVKNTVSGKAKNHIATLYLSENWDDSQKNGQAKMHFFTIVLCHWRLWTSLKREPGWLLLRSSRRNDYVEEIRRPSLRQIEWSWNANDAIKPSHWRKCTQFRVNILLKHIHWANESFGPQYLANLCVLRDIFFSANNWKIKHLLHKCSSELVPVYRDGIIATQALNYAHTAIVLECCFFTRARCSHAAKLGERERRMGKGLRTTKSTRSRTFQLQYLKP